MKFPRYFVIFGLCVLSIQLGMITCQNDDDTSDSDNVADTSVSDTNSVSDSENVVDDSSSSDSNSDVSESNDADTVSSDDDSSSSVDDSSSSDDTSSSNTEEQSTSDADSDDSVDSDVVEDTESETEEDSEPAAPAVGTELVFDLTAGTAGQGLTASIRFEVMENNALKMYCDVTAEAGSSAADFWPDEFASDDSSSDSESSSDDSSSSSDTVSTDEDANVVSNDVEENESDATSSDQSSDATSDDSSSVSDTNSDDSSSVSDTTSDDSSSDSDTASNDDSSSDSDSSSTNDVTSDDTSSSVSDDTSNDDTSNDAVDSSDANDASTVSEGDENTSTSQIRATSCSGTMPHLYVIKDTSCCSDPHQSQCASVEGKKLGCLEATGSVEHTFEDVSYYDFESSCLAITDKEVPTTRSGLRTPKFLTAGPSFFRTFGLLNFNSVNFLSSGTKTVTSSSSTGAISFNYPASSPSYSGGSSYTPGFLDTLPHIRLEGLTADYLNAIIVILLIAYIGSAILPLFNVGPLFSQLSVPFSRAGDFLSAKMDILENKVKSSIRRYNRRYYNNVRRVDYDLNYDDEYYDDDYYYYVK